MNESHYTSQIDQIFDKLEASSHRPTQTYDTNVNVWQVGLVIGGVVLAVSTAPVLIMNDFSGQSILASAGLFISGMVLAISGNEECSTTPIMNTALKLVGRAAPLSEDQAKDLSIWSQRHPRLAPILGQWAASNKDGRLNSDDYTRAGKHVAQVENIKKDMATASAIEEQLRAGGIESATRRVKLTNIAESGAKGQAQSNSKPAM